MFFECFLLVKQPILKWACIYISRVRKLPFDLKKILLLVTLLVIFLVIPFRLHATNSVFEFNSILLHISYYSFVGSLSIEFTPYSTYFVPSLLLCAPCFIWFYKEQDLSFPILLLSVGAVVLSMTLILLLFLPLWAIIPWAFDVVAAVVPEFVDLVPIAGIIFTSMVLLRLIWRMVLYPTYADITLGKKIAAMVLSLSILLLPMTIETFNWTGTDFNRTFFEGYSLNSATWSFSHRVDGNMWGQSAQFNFSVSSIYSCLAYLLQILPGIIFAWFVCKRPIDRKGITIMLAAGLTHLLVVSLSCIWVNFTASYPGYWTIAPFPALFIIGVIIISMEYGYRWAMIRRFRETNRVSEEKILSQVTI